MWERWMDVGGCGCGCASVAICKPQKRKDVVAVRMHGEV